MRALLFKSASWELDMTELLYQTDSYLREFSAAVTTVDPEAHAVILDQTAFYPGGGGQPADRGDLLIRGRTYPVGKVKKDGTSVLHVIEGDALPEVGAPVQGRIDWEHRYQLMRTHTAMHILCGVVWRDYGALVTGGNMEPLKGRMDFEFETMRQELVREIEHSVNTEVANAHDIRVAILPREEAFQIPDLIRTKINLLPDSITEVRTVEIVGLDLQADGGTHVANTSEVGRLRVADYKSKGKINKRIYLEVE
jgi:misacylated tRNA(Ala) deacylase